MGNVHLHFIAKMKCHQVSLGRRWVYLFIYVLVMDIYKMEKIKIIADYLGDRKFQIHSRKEYIYFMLRGPLVKMQGFDMVFFILSPFFVFQKNGQAVI